MKMLMTLSIERILNAKCHARLNKFRKVFKNKFKNIQTVKTFYKLGAALTLVVSFAAFSSEDSN